MAVFLSTIMTWRNLLNKHARLIDISPPLLSQPIQHVFVEKRVECIDDTCKVFSNQLPDSLKRSVPKRQYEFVIGRLAAAFLLNEINIPAKQLWLQAQQRRPLWPAAACGSISHSSELVAVSVGRKQAGLQSIGMDIELLCQEIDTMIAMQSCFYPAELQLLKNIQHGEIIGFSMKESLFKCINPITQIFFDFLEVKVTQINALDRSVTLELLGDLGAEFSAGSRIRGNYQLLNGHVWTVIQWPFT
jgi:enterobactin synthetase component D